MEREPGDMGKIKEGGMGIRNWGCLRKKCKILNVKY
jgi:hypothetical protein